MPRDAPAATTRATGETVTTATAVGAVNGKTATAAVLAIATVDETAVLATATVDETAAVLATATVDETTKQTCLEKNTTTHAR